MRKAFLISAFIFFFTLPLLAHDVDTAWVRRYNGLGNSIDRATAIAVDSLGNVYVTGLSYSGVTGNDYVTIKYNKNGTVVWVNTTDGGSSSYDSAAAIAIDGSGNVYVTGCTWVSLSDWDYFTIKLEPDSGNIPSGWPQYYSYLPDSQSYDFATAIAVDNSGYVYVTGYSYGGGTIGYDYATIKYEPNGNIATSWPQRYNNEDGNGFDRATDITVDKYGYVYVTGESYGSGTAADYATIKYEPDGDIAPGNWPVRYDGYGEYDSASAIAVDDSGYVYVTGSSAKGPGIRDNYDYLTTKYNPDGSVAPSNWPARYEGLEFSLYDQAFAIAVDNRGYVTVTGRSGQSKIGDTTIYDYATIKYLPNGGLVSGWPVRYDEFASDDQASDIDVDALGNVYVSGKSKKVTDYDYTTVMYDFNGDTNWVVRYNLLGILDDKALAIEVPCFGNVYVTGESYDAGSSEDYATIKYYNFVRGDANNDGGLSVSDAIYLINYLFKGGLTPDPLEVGDCNCDCKVSISDIIFLIYYLFMGGSKPNC